MCGFSILSRFFILGMALSQEERTAEAPKGIL